MIKIIKNGNPNHTPRRIYTATCFACGCEFEFESNDIKERDYNGTFTIVCPCCHKNIGFSNREVNKRIEVVEDEKNN